MPKISSRFLENTSISAASRARLSSQMNIPPGTKIQLMAFEVNCDGQTYYCCLSGGRLENGQPLFTPVGQAALDALLSVSPDGKKRLRIQELRMGETPLAEKMANAFRKAGPGGAVCFLGDMAGELDGHALRALNLVGPTIQ